MTKAADKILADYQAYTKIKPKRKIENIKAIISLWGNLKRFSVNGFLNFI